jgi:hypothetical protein
MEDVIWLRFISVVDEMYQLRAFGVIHMIVHGSRTSGLTRAQVTFKSQASRRVSVGAWISAKRFMDETKGLNEDDIELRNGITFGKTAFVVRRRLVLGRT